MRIIWLNNWIIFDNLIPRDAMLVRYL